jgi:hypothetical protein
MEQKYFMHRIKLDGGTYTKGIEVHDTKDSAILSYHGYMAQGFGNETTPNVTFVSCKITDIYGNILYPFNETWNPGGLNDKVFLHHIRYDGSTFSKDIDIYDTFDAAKLSYHKNEAYGYNNPKFSTVEFVNCFITDQSGHVLTPYSENWIKEDGTPTVIES